MQLITIVGARPQFIKIATVSRQLRLISGVREILVHTGQHFDENMSQVFFDELEIPKPDFNLGIGGGSHGQNTGRMIEAIEKVLLEEKADYVLVFGDTDSTLAGTMAAVKLHIPVVHIEAGLRSFNRRMPEEINRVLTDHAASLLFAPTQTAVDNLRKEGISGSKVQNVGDVMYDAALFYASKAQEKSRILEKLELKPKQFILSTVHRAENTDDPEKLNCIMESLNLIGRNMEVVVPLHPRTRKQLAHINFTPQPGLRFIAPVGYLDMVMLEKNAAVIATDSGGVQKEAFFHQVPCVTLRSETEWVELVELGWNRLADPNSTDAIVTAIQEAGSSAPLPGLKPYGAGNSAELILKRLISVAS